MTENRFRGEAPCVLVLGLLAAACSDSAPNETGVERIDSAGTQIVVNATATPPVWRLSPEPELSIGVLEGESAYEFGLVADARTLADGGIVLTDVQSREVREFGPEGEHRWTAGREGDGPGEFRAPFNLTVRGDTLVVFDPRLNRFTRLDLSDGGLISILTPQVRILNAGFLTMLEDGSTLFDSDEYILPDAGFSQMYTVFLRVSADGNTVDSLPRQPLAMMGVLDSEGRMVGSPLFSPQGLSAGGRNAYWVTSAAEPEMKQIAPDGSVRRIVRWPDWARSVTQADVDRYLEVELAETSEEFRPAVRQRITGQPVADEHAISERLVVGRDGRVWLKVTARPGVVAPTSWLVFDRDGVLEGRVEYGFSGRVLEVGADYLLAAVQDEFDVQRVQRFRVPNSQPNR